MPPKTPCCDAPESEVERLIAEVNQLALSWKDRIQPHKPATSEQSTRLAADCAGYGSEVIAFTLLGLRRRAQVVMLSEIDPAKQALHPAVVKQCGWPRDRGHVYADIMKRDDEAAPSADVYIAGYPCPSYSKLGRRQGAADARGLVTLKGLRYIAAKRPRVVVLEQVAALKSKKHKRVWEFVQKIFHLLQYDMVHQVISPKHVSVPQSRDRLYLCAVAQESKKRKLSMPQPRSSCTDLHFFIDKAVRGEEMLSLPIYEEKLGQKMWEKLFILDVGSSLTWQHPLKNLSPCLTKARLQGNGFYLPKLRRRLRLAEAARLQSVPQEVAMSMRRKAERRGLKARTVEAALGDAMSIAVLMTALTRALDASGLTEDCVAKKDYWMKVPLGEPSARMVDRLFAQVCGGSNK